MNLAAFHSDFKINNVADHFQLPINMNGAQ